MIKLLALILLSFSVIAETAIPDYERSSWPHWSDNDRDCQDARHEILIRQSLIEVVYKTDRKCKVVSGKWYGQFLGKFFTESSDLDLDHIIPLKWAHVHGGWRWTRVEKERFANDFENLILVDDGRNQSKGSKGPGFWMPNNSALHCDYVFKWKHLINKYNLSTNQTDKVKILNVIEACGLSIN